MSGALTAMAQASSKEVISVKRLICAPDYCATLVDLWIEKLRLFSVIRASGGESSAANTDFNHSRSEVSFSEALSGVQGRSLGGGKSSIDSGVEQRVIGSQDIICDVRPGTELVLSMSVYATASVSGGWIDQPGTVHSDCANATANFSHTLQWMGVSGIQAFGVDRQEIFLPDGARVELLGSSGYDNRRRYSARCTEPSVLPGGLLASLEAAGGSIPAAGCRWLPL